MEDEHEITSALHARRKNRSPMARLSCCFNSDHRRSSSLFDISSTIMPSPNRRSPSSWIRNKHSMPRMGKHRRHSSADFSYDPLSYALNFEDCVYDDPSEPEDPTRNFSSRLPATPSRAAIVASAPLQGVPRGTSHQPSPAEIRRNLELPEPRRPPGLKKQSLEVPTQRKLVPTAEDSRSIDQSMSRAAAVAEVRRSLEFEDISPSRQVLVELC